MSRHLPVQWMKSKGSLLPQIRMIFLKLCVFWDMFRIFGEKNCLIISKMGRGGQPCLEKVKKIVKICGRRLSLLKPEKQLPACSNAAQPSISWMDRTHKYSPICSTPIWTSIKHCWIWTIKIPSFHSHQQLWHQSQGLKACCASGGFSQGRLQGHHGSTPPQVAALGSGHR